MRMELILASQICIREEWTLFIGIKDEESYFVHVVSDKVEGRRIIRSCASETPELRAKALTDIETSGLPETSETQTLVISGESGTYLAWALKMHEDQTEDEEDEVEDDEVEDDELEDDELEDDEDDDCPYYVYLVLSVRGAKTSEVGAMIGYYGPDEQYHLFLFSNVEDGLTHLEQKLAWLDDARKEGVRSVIESSFLETETCAGTESASLHLVGTIAEFLGSLASVYEEKFYNDDGDEEEETPESESQDIN